MAFPFSNIVAKHFLNTLQYAPIYAHTNSYGKREWPRIHGVYVQNINLDGEKHTQLL